MNPLDFKELYKNNPRSAQLKLRYNHDIMLGILNYLGIDYEIPNNAAIYMLIHDIFEKPICTYCNNNILKFKGITKGGFAHTCDSDNCKKSYRSDLNKKSSKKINWKSSVQKAKKTNLTKTGFESNFSGGSPSRNLYKEILIEKYGVEHPLQNKDILNKAQFTMLENHGTLNMIQSEKSKKTIKDKYGVENVMQNEKIKQKNRVIQSKNKWKTLKENSKKYLNLDISYINNTCDNWLVANCITCGQKITKLHRLNLTRCIISKNTPCTSCSTKNTYRSSGENEISEFIKSFYKGEIQHNRKYIKDGLEVDILIPDLKIGIEFNGIYWHSQKFKNKLYHINKKKKIEDEGWTLIQIWEDDWNNNIKREIIKSRLKSKLGHSENIIYARKCKVKEIDTATSNNFLTNNHLYGSSISKIKLGLYYNNQLVMVMTFGKPRKFVSGHTKYDWELIRMCPLINTNIVGGFSKILSYFKNLVGKDTSLISYSDCDWASYYNNSYTKVGFKIVKITQPGYWWVVNNIRTNRYNYTRFKIKDIDENETVDEYMYKNKFYKIWNSGNILFILN